MPLFDKKKFLGVVAHGDRLKIAVVTSDRSGLKLEKVEEIGRDEFFKEKYCHVVTLLSSAETLRREVHLNVRGRAPLLKTLPFQLESLLPFNSGEAVVYPYFFKAGTGTDVVVFATTRSGLSHHIAHYSAIDPDQISCVPRALYRWARLLFPHETQISLIDPAGAVVIDGEKIVFSQPVEEPSRMEYLFKSKFGHAVPIGNNGPDFQGFSYALLKEYALPIGAALEGALQDGCQFRQGEYTAPRVSQKKNRLLRLQIGVAVVSALGVGAVSFWKLQRQEQQLAATIQTHFSGTGTLAQQLSEWEQRLIAEAQRFPLIPNAPLVQDVLAWIGSVNHPIEIVQFDYQLINYPKAGEKIEPYNVRVELEFKADTAEIARRFREALEQEPSLIDKQQKITWNGQHNSFKLSFELRKKTAS